MKSIEEAISENAKGILASTMKQEIGELVRESIMGSKKSLREQAQGGQQPQPQPQGSEEEGEEEVSGDEEVEAPPAPNTDNGMEGAPQGPTEELPPLDMTKSPMSDVMKVFKAMGDEDGFIIQKDGNYVHLKDGKSNTEYLISMEVDEPEMPAEQPVENMAENTIYELVYEDNSMSKNMDGMDYNEDEDIDNEEEVYVDDEEDVDSDDDFNWTDDSLSASVGGKDYNFRIGMAQDKEIDMDENVYEIDQESFENVVEAFKAKGKIGKLKTKIYPSKLKHGVTETDEDEISDGWLEEIEDDEDEATEAARTYGNGSKKGRGLRKSITPNRNLTYESYELDSLREKNEEYRKALDFFRNKLNEVAIFNSNLAYATRLFTEHSTTKQEKINILRRFDNVESLKESKSLYKTIKEEIGESPNSIMNESITQKVVKTPSNGSSSNLIESKAYENPQFMRMKDLMNKIK